MLFTFAQITEKQKKCFPFASYANTPEYRETNHIIMVIELWLKRPSIGRNHNN